MKPLVFGVLLSLGCHRIIGYDDLHIEPSDAASEGATDAAVDSSIDAPVETFTDAGGDVPPLEQRAFPMPHPPGAGTPVRDYDLSRSGSVIDKVTGLEWTAAPIGIARSHAAAVTECGLPRDGASDWRLPSVLELTSLFDPSAARAALLDPTAFPGDESGLFWTREAVAGETGTHWVVGFAGMPGTALGVLADAQADANPERVRCVRTTFVPSTEPRFTTGATTIVDHHTRLEWERIAASPQVLAEDAATYCAGLTGGFRVPTVKELFTLVDLRMRDPAVQAPFVDTAHTGETRYGSTTVVGTSRFGVRFDRGMVWSWTNTFSHDWVRCVRSLP